MKTRGKVLALVGMCLLSGCLAFGAFAASGRPLDASGHIGMEAAKEIALTHAGAGAGNVTFTKVKLDYDHGMAEYELKFTWNGSRYDYEIDAASGEITSYSQKEAKRPRRTGGGAADTSGYIGLEKAKEIALAHAGISADRAELTKAKLDRDRKRGRAEYDIEFYVNGTEYEFEIDASTGKILDYSFETYD